MSKKGNKLLRILVGVALPFIIFLVFYIDRIYPRVYVGNFYLGGKSTEEAVSFLKANLKTPTEITLISPTQTYKLNLSDFNFAYDLPKTVNKAYLLGRTGNPIFDAGEITSALINKRGYGLDIKLDEEALAKNLSIIGGQITTDPVYPTVQLTNGKIIIQNGKSGTDIDLSKLRIDIGQKLSFADSTLSVNIKIKTIDPSLTNNQIKRIKLRYEKLIGKDIKVDIDNQDIVLNDIDIIPLLDINGGFSEPQIVLLIQKLAKQVERDPQNASFTFLPAQAGEVGHVKGFAPEKDGIKITRDVFKQNIVNALSSLTEKDLKEVIINTPVTKTPAKIKTSDVNNLGIKELIGRGTSHFAGSIASRIHNITLAASKLNGVLVEPGQVFSFDEAIGDISLYSGYQQAYIIEGGKTVLGDGGGVCQVSTTIFRTTMNAGLPIIERNAHAYRVHYYEEDALPGLDATVYSPSVDFKFKNDTPGAILIQTHTDLNNLVLTFEFYGTNDGRKATISKPILSNYIPAPTPLYTDDPTLPKGVIKQIDFAAPGTNSKFDYTVERNGEIIFQKTFYSNFRPWQAKFLVGTRV